VSRAGPPCAILAALVRRLLILVLALAVGGTATRVAVSRRDEEGREAPARPNILLVLTDDQRADQLAGMPAVTTWFERGGTRFSRAFAQNPLCCPSRASLLTGQAAHNHGVNDNTEESVAKLNLDAALPVSLRLAGYRTAYLGKLFNGWTLGVPPPGFDHWSVMKAGYTDADFDVDGTVGPVPGHSSSVIAEHATRLLGEWEAGDEQPWFLVVAPFAPHWPYEPLPGDEAEPVPPFPRRAPIQRGDPEGLPPVVRDHHSDPARVRPVWDAQARSLLSVDRLVGALAARIASLGEDDTLAFYVSDNGYLLGEQGIVEDKRMPYDMSVRVPLLVRWPRRVAADDVDARLALQLDIPATIYDVTGIPPAFPIDGYSLFGSHRRERVQFEHLGDGEIPPWASVRDDEWQYVEWYDDAGSTVVFRELFDLRNDPGQRVNRLAGRPDDDDVSRAARMAETLARDRTCAGTTGEHACP
jgi:arylsulfatase A-like enzyme